MCLIFFTAGILSAQKKKKKKNPFSSFISKYVSKVFIEICLSRLTTAITAGLFLGTVCACVMYEEQYVE